MNILHHKSWHVRNKDNIQRVKRDEAKAAEEEKERLKRQSLAESEARLNILRSRSSINFEKGKDAQEPTTAESGFINLFESAEQGKQSDVKNKEAELEKAQEKEKFEKKIGLLKYLVDDELDMKTQPWYKKSRKDTYKEPDTNFEVDLKRKLRDDPMKEVSTYLREKDKKKKKKSHKSHDYEKDSKHSESKKNKKSDKEKDEPEVKKKKTIEELRAERLKREAEARVLTNRLLYGIKDDEEKEPKVEVDDRKRRYNNQFNPEMSRY